MSKPYSETDLSAAFDADLIWRRKELSDLKAAVRSADQVARPALLRSLVAMAYAHWEGYVRTCANKYFEHIGLRKWSYDKLERQFYANAYLGRLDALRVSRANISDRSTLVMDILDGESTRFAYINPGLVDTKSNLNTDVVKDICLVCGVDGGHFEGKRIFIDTLILKRRNAIAHGQQEFVHESEMNQLVADMLALMDHFRTLLENKVYTKQYLRPAPAAPAVAPVP